MSLSLQSSYFSIGDIFKPQVWLDKWLNPYAFSQSIVLRKHVLDVLWTNRFNQALLKRQSPLYIEMQLYFSCMVKKRVLFHDTPFEDMGLQDSIEINDYMQTVFRAVQASSCDPIEFAKNYPVKQEFRTLPALKMHPTVLKLDYKKGKWVGEFSV